jgi:hypothetical protein
VAVEAAVVVMEQTLEIVHLAALVGLELLLLNMHQQLKEHLEEI